MGPYSKNTNAHPSAGAAPQAINHIAMEAIAVWDSKVEKSLCILLLVANKLALELKVAP